MNRLIGSGWQYPCRTSTTWYPDRITFALSLCRTLDDGCIKAGLERKVHLDALRQQEPDARRRLDEVLDLSALPPATLAFDELRRKLSRLRLSMPMSLRQSLLARCSEVLSSFAVVNESGL